MGEGSALITRCVQGNSVPMDVEASLWERGVTHVAGVDEAGRGCLAGPVVAAAVVLPHGVELPGVRDSKKLSSSQRERMFNLIKKECIEWAIGLVDSGEIDDINILQAALKAMQLAVSALTCRPGCLLIDGNQRIVSTIPQITLTKGESKSLSVAAASIIAKVSRDHLMIEMADQYKGFTFAAHKGYGTARHLEELREHGPTLIHRMTFAPVKSNSKPF